MPFTTNYSFKIDIILKDKGPFLCSSFLGKSTDLMYDYVLFTQHTPVSGLGNLEWP